mmetsp:Transcript_73584/g.213125  ORF Transcript_73584/g.213125 Transcript_73584/m.213125 type:complete len:413 (+) Transcript_73584:1732-2970(+)
MIAVVGHVFDAAPCQRPRGSEAPFRGTPRVQRVRQASVALLVPPARHPVLARELHGELRRVPGATATLATRCEGIAPCAAIAFRGPPSSLPTTAGGPVRSAPIVTGILRATDTVQICPTVRVVVASPAASATSRDSRHAARGIVRDQAPRFVPPGPDVAGCRAIGALVVVRTCVRILVLPTARHVHADVLLPTPTCAARLLRRGPLRRELVDSAPRRDPVQTRLAGRRAPMVLLIVCTTPAVAVGPTRDAAGAPRCLEAAAASATCCERRPATVGEVFKVRDGALEVRPWLTVGRAPLVPLVLLAIVVVGVHPSFGVVGAAWLRCRGRRPGRRRGARLPIAEAAAARATRRERNMTVVHEAFEVRNGAMEVGPRLAIGRAPLVLLILLAIVSVGVRPTLGVVGAAWLRCRER